MSNDEYLRHEALDRLHVVREIVVNHLLEHKYIDEDEALRKQVQIAIKALTDAYQALGAIHIRKD